MNADKENNMVEAKPTEGKGERNISCPLDPVCLSYAAEKDWKAFHCEKCPQMTEDGKIIDGKIIKETDVEGEMEDKVKICKGCGVPKALDEFHVHTSAKDGRHYLCKVCRAENNKEKAYWKKGEKDVSRKAAKALSEDSRKKAQKTQKIEIKKQEGEENLQSTIDNHQSKRLVLMEFAGEISWVYDALRRYAGEELRSIPDQAIFMLRESMRHDGMDEVIELTEKGQNDYGQNDE